MARVKPRAKKGNSKKKASQKKQKNDKHLDDVVKVDAFEENTTSPHKNDAEVYPLTHPAYRDRERKRRNPYSEWEGGKTEYKANTSDEELDYSDSEAIPQALFEGKHFGYLI